MPSKYTGYIHASQKDMDTVVKIDPTINELDTDFNGVLRYIWDKFKSGGYVQTDKEKVDIKLKNEKLQQEVINLKIKNKIAIIHDLKVAPNIANKIVENKIPIEQIIGGTNDSPVRNINDGISIYDANNNSFECKDCGVLFPMDSRQLPHMQKAQMKFLEHIDQKHHRQCTGQEIQNFKDLGIPL